MNAVSFVATPRFNPDVNDLDPCYITTSSIVSGGSLILYARTWDCRCDLKPHTAFDYHLAIA